MHVANQIDKLVLSLNELKPLLSNDKASNEEKFSELLRRSLSNQKIETLDQQNASAIPNWVHPDYDYDPSNPRKPNMRELMEIMSGKGIEDLYSDTNENLQSLIRNSSEILYGVVGSNEDTRDWPTIMAAKDIVATAQAETGKMYDPKIDIQSSVNGNQVAVIKDKSERVLRVVPTDTILADETLRNFGVTHISIPLNLEAKVIDGKFDKTLLDFLKNFDKDTDQNEKNILRTATDATSNGLAEEISSIEYNKL